MTLLSELSMSQLNALETAFWNRLTLQKGRFASGPQSLRRVMAERLEYFGAAKIDFTQAPPRLLVTPAGKEALEAARRIPARERAA